MARKPYKLIARWKGLAPVTKRVSFDSREARDAAVERWEKQGYTVEVRDE